MLHISHLNTDKGSGVREETHNEKVKLILLDLIRIPSGASCKGLPPTENTFYQYEDMYLHRDSNPSLWNTVFHSSWRYNGN